MKYTLNFSEFYDNIRLNPTHVSLYLALFQLCNLIYFQSFISISQHEMIKLCRIAVFGTYHKRIKDIKSFPQIEYLPSFNFCKKCILNLYNFDERAVQNLNSYHTKNQTSFAQALNQHHIKIDTGIEQALIPSINYINILNNKHIITTSETCSIFKQAFLLFIPHEEILLKITKPKFQRKRKVARKEKESLADSFCKKNIQDGSKKKNTKSLPIQSRKISTNLAEVKIFCRKKMHCF